MQYQKTIEYLYSQLPVYQQSGDQAYKPGLERITQLCEYLGNPQKQFAAVHVGGTNGKGSSAHMIAAALQSVGRLVGLYTSPHLNSFTERIKLNGQEIEPDWVVNFVSDTKHIIEKIEPSFFEITVAMAFSYFAESGVDIAVIEVGLGGRLDSTNIIYPEVSLITNISFDHQKYLGNTLSEIAREKAGIIKKDRPIVISEFQLEIEPVFQKVAAVNRAPLFFAQQFFSIEKIPNNLNAFKVYREETVFMDRLRPSLRGNYQLKNIIGVLKTIEVLQNRGWQIPKEHQKAGIEHTGILTGLKGRWQILSKTPLIVCDVGHNYAAIQEVLEQLSGLSYQKLHIILGFSQDKDIKKILMLYPSNAFYYFCQYDSPRALSAKTLQEKAQEYDLKGQAFNSVNEAVDQARAKANAEDIILIGGSAFLVAELKDL